MKKRIASLLLCAVLLCGLMPGNLALAAEPDRAIMPGLSGISGYDSTNGYDYIYYGNWTAPDEYTTSGPIKWRVLDDQTNTKEPGLFLLTEELFGTGPNGGVYFDSSDPYSNVWQGSDAQAWCTEFYSSSLSESEQGAVLETAKSDAAYTTQSAYRYQFDASENILNGDTCFFLSAEEAENSAYGFTSDEARTANYGDHTVGSWWLRSPRTDKPANAGNVSYLGIVSGLSAEHDWFAGRPALNLDTSKVLFTSAAENGKPDGELGILSAVEANDSGAWKLTLLDTERHFTVTDLSGGGAAGSIISISYSGANAGDNEYVSAIFEQNGRYLYYGHIAQGSESGKANLTIPAGLPNGEYTLYLFSEQCNGDQKTDYASAFQGVALTIEGEPIPVHSISAGPASLNFGSATVDYTPAPAAQTVTVRNTGNQAVTIDLPDSLNYLITAGDGFEGGKATLAANGSTAAFTVQPNPGLGEGEYPETLTISGSNNVTAEVTLFFTVEALDTKADRSVMPGTAGIESPTPSAETGRIHYTPKDYLYFGMNRNSPIMWRVLDAEKANDRQTDGMFLLSDDLLAAMINFDHDVIPNDGQEDYNEWQHSDVQTWCADFANNEDHFSALEQAAMQGIAKQEEKAELFDFKWRGSELTEDDKLFFLSAQELADYVANYNRAPTAQCSNAWWLRSAVADPRLLVGSVYGDGELSDSRVDYQKGARPAFNLDSANILFTSQAQGGKPDGGLKVVSNYDGNEWKATLLDSGRSGFAASTTAKEGDTLTITYSGAAIGEKEYISALIADNNGAYTHYGRLQEVGDTAGGTVKIDLTGIDMNGKTLYVFNEQYNGDQKTDYASELKAVELTVEGEPDPVYSISATPASLNFGSETVGYTAVPAAQTVTVRNTGNQEITLTPPTAPNYSISLQSGSSLTLAPNGTAAFTVQPKTGLDVGSYSETLTISGSNNVTATVVLSFTVEAAPQPTEYIITFDGNGGTSPAAQTTVGGKLAALPDSTRNGYTLNGWFTAKTGGEKVDTNTAFTQDTTVYAQWKQNEQPQPTEYTITFDANGGSMTTSTATTANGKLTSLPTPTRGGYDFAGWYTAKTGGTKVTTNYEFTANATIYAHWDKRSTSSGGSGGSGGPSKTPSQQAVDKIESAKDGSTVEITLRTGQTKLDKEVFEELAGRDVTLEISLPDGVTWTVNGQNIPRSAKLSDLDLGVTLDASTIPVSVINTVTGAEETIQLSLKHDGAFGFTMTLTAPLGKTNAGYWANLYYYDKDSRTLEFQAADKIASDGTAEFAFSYAFSYAIVIDTVSHEPLPFTDVPEDAWYADAAAYVYKHGLMAGTSATTFAPDTTTSRAMIATILWRMAGSPVVNYAMDYTDVAQDQWCSEAIRWATSEGVVTGYGNGLFGINDPITREQLASMLWRYAQAEGYDVSVGENTNILSYTDAADVSEYAIPAMQWACGAGIINGTGDGSTLNPQGQTNRAQAAVMLMRFCEEYVTW